MPTKLRLALTLGTFAAAATGAACSNLAEDCDKILCAEEDATSTSTGPGTGGSGGSGGEGGSGGGGGTPVGCVPSEADAPVASTCGVFVSADGDDAAAGTPAAPLRTLAKALEVAETAGKPVYACAQDFAEAVTLAAPVDSFGGLDCEAGTWAWVGETSKTRIAAPADAVALVIEPGASGSLVADFLVEAASAMAPGGSSIAVLVDEASAELVRCDVVAGDGAAGDEGTDGGAQMSPAPPGSLGADANTTKAGGAAVENTCTNGVSTGGKGGDGGTPVNGSGQNGDGGDVGTGGTPGAGEFDVSWSCATGSGVGGGTGPAGDPGTGGGEDAALGTLTSNGFAGADGAAGMPGARGKGGGGGGGSKATTLNGAGGGSGGPGGCGGKAGSGGKSGGSSIGIASVNATLTLTQVTIRLGQAGAGGVGGDGQLGQQGGAAGPGGASSGAVNPGCPGGLGGKGGNGGSGGGGRGGHAIGVAFVGAPAMGRPTLEAAGAVGTGALGGTNGIDMGGQGLDGIAAPSQAF